MSAIWLRREPPRDPDEPGVVAVGAPPLATPPLGGADVARNLRDVRRMVLTWLWAGREVGARLTAPLGD
jgi:hypothetical protein